MGSGREKRGRNKEDWRGQKAGGGPGSKENKFKQSEEKTCEPEQEQRKDTGAVEEQTGQGHRQQCRERRVR